MRDECHICKTYIQSYNTLYVYCSGGGIYKYIQFERKGYKLKG